MEVRIASMSKRVVAYLIDFTMISIVTILIAIPFGYGRVISDYLYLLHNYDILYYVDGLSIYDYYEFHVYLKWNQGIEIAIYFLFILYCILMENSYRQATFGKQIMKIKVVDLEGRKLYLKESVKRNLFKIISLLPWFLGCIWAFFTNKKQAWHDMFAKTLVVDAAFMPNKVTNVEEVDLKKAKSNEAMSCELKSYELKSFEAMDRFELERESKGYKPNGQEDTGCGEFYENIIIPPWIVLSVLLVVIVFIAFVLIGENL